MSPQAVPSSLTFGNTAIGTSSPPQTITFSNAGSTAFTVTGFQVTENFTQSNNCPASIAPGASCTITVKFAPGLDNFQNFPSTGYIYIGLSAPGSPFAIPLSGFATASTGAATTTAVTSSPNPSNVGQSVTFTATVTSQTAGTITGTVSFFDGANQIGMGTLTASSATFSTTSLAGGSHSITAQYSGNNTYAPSTSMPLMQAVNSTGKAATSTAVTSSANPATGGQSITFTGAVTSQTAGTITGSVAFFDGNSQIGTGNLSGGSATYATSSLSAGSHSITAQYSGDANYAPSTSTALTQTVNATGDYSVSISPASATLPAGQSATSTFSVAPIGGATYTVQLSCGSVPATMTCSFTPTSVTLDGTHTATSMVTIGTTANGSLPSASRWPTRPLWPPAWVAGLALIGATLLLSIVALGRQAVRDAVARRLLLASTALIVVAALGSCSGGGNHSSGTPAGTYTITLTGASTTSNLSHSTTDTITVTK
jgi:Bacterial Ig-like domain (group 3)